MKNHVFMQKIMHDLGAKLSFSTRSRGPFLRCFLNTPGDRYDRGGHISGTSAKESHHETGDDYFSPITNRSPQSSFSSPQVSVDSPRISFSPLHIKDSIEVSFRDRTLKFFKFCSFRRKNPRKNLATLLSEVSPWQSQATAPRLPWPFMVAATTILLKVRGHLEVGPLFLAIGLLSWGGTVLVLTSIGTPYIPAPNILRGLGRCLQFLSDPWTLDVEYLVSPALGR